MDLRDSYQGFKNSHASIMRNALNQVPGIEKLVQIGIRDFCEEELEFARSQNGRVIQFFDHDLQYQKQEGRNFSSIADDIISHLPANVWISFDIDGLDPKYCPNTGTPVPGGLDFFEAISLFKKIAHSGRRIVGFDLVEVAPSKDSTNEWDANVGARLLYKLSGWTLFSCGILKETDLKAPSIPVE